MTAAEAAGLIDRDIMLDSCLAFSFITQEMNHKLFGVTKDLNALQQNATLIKLTAEGNQRPYDVTLAVAPLFGSLVTITDEMTLYIVNETF